MNGRLRVKRGVLDQLMAEAWRRPDLECCGLLAGRDGIISVVLPAENALRSATAYEIAPEELFALFRRMRAEKLEHLGIYHSHPRGENAPSPRDIEGAFYPDAAHFILSPRTDAVQPVRAFRIDGADVCELILDLV